MKIENMTEMESTRPAIGYPISSLCIPSKPSVPTCDFNNVKTNNALSCPKDLGLEFVDAELLNILIHGSSSPVEDPILASYNPLHNVFMMQNNAQPNDNKNQKSANLTDKPAV